MAIVRNDRRPDSIAALKETRDGLYRTLQDLDGSLAALDDLEVNLGLATQDQQADREQYLVMHFPKGADTGHTLDECEGKGCASDAIVDALEEGNDADADGEPDADEPKSA